MKKLFLTVIVLTKLFCVDAQNFSVNYMKSTSPSESILFNSNDNVAPQMEQQITIGYSQNILKSNFFFNLYVAGAETRPPKKPVVPLLPCPECTIKATKQVPKGSIIGFKNPQSTSVSFLGGLGYTIPHKAGSRLTVSLNVDGGVAINSDQDLQLIYDRKVLETFTFEKYQTIINPSLKVKVALTNRLGINLGGGYSNIGGVNLTTGLSFNPFSRKGCGHMRCCGNCELVDPNERR